jgi:hypothetical protein
MLSFGFAGKDFLAVSIETRRERHIEALAGLPIGNRIAGLDKGFSLGPEDVENGFCVVFFPASISDCTPSSGEEKLFCCAPAPNTACTVASATVRIANAMTKNSYQLATNCLNFASG